MTTKKKSFEMWIFSLILFLAFMLPVGCQRSPAQPSGETPGGQTESKMSLAVYYVKYTENDAYLVRELHEVAKVTEAAMASMEELLRGTPLTPGAAGVLPENTQVRGIEIDENGLATVDFTPEVLKANVGSTGEALGISSVVNTLTEFPTIKQVAFTVDGKVDARTKEWWGHVGLYNQPFVRDLSNVYEPAIWVSSPAPNQTVKSPVEIKGSARVFEATVCVRVVDEQGKILSQGFTTATAGAPERGDFKISLEFSAASPGKGTVEAYSESPKDGSIVNLYQVPVNW